MKPFLGIDLGTTNSAVGHYGVFGPEVIKVDGAETMPTLVMLVPTDDPEKPWDVVVGQKAVRAREKNPRSKFCFSSFKRYLGAVFNPEEITDEQMTAGPSGMLHYQGPDGFTYAPEELVSYVLAHLRKAAVERLEQDVTQVILCVPATYNIAQREALRRAGEMAGFTEIELMNEPVAAAIAHGYQIDDDKAHTIFVLDVGGGTTDTAALQIGQGLYRVLGTNGAALVGGDDWDRHIRAQILNMHEFDYEESELAAKSDAMRLLLAEAQETKHRLSDEEMTEFRVEDIDIDLKTGEDIHVIRPFSRDLMNEVTSELLAEIESAITRTVEEAKQRDPRFSIKDFDAVILVGGQVRVKAIQRRVANVFQKTPRSDVDPELAVVLGASIQAGIREGRLSSITIENITSHGFSIETHDKAEDVATEIVRKGTAYGTKATWWLSNRDPDQTRMTLRLLQGDAKDPAFNLMVWEQHIDIEPGLPRSAEIQLDVEIGPSGEPILDVAGYSYGRGAAP